MRLPSPTPPTLRICAAALLLAMAAPFAQASGPVERAPQELIDDLDQQMRVLLEKPQPGRTPEDAEREAALRISAWSER